MSGNVGRGILAMLVAVAAFAVMDAAIKELVQTYTPWQVASLRGLMSIPFFLFGVAVAGQWRDLVPNRWTMHIVRGVIAVVMLLAFIYSVQELPLATAYGIFLSAPLLITALSAVVLREYVGWHRWAAIVCGLAGVIVILNPESTGIVTLAGLAAFSSALCYAVAALMIRRLSQTDATLSIGFSFIVIVSVVTGVAAYPNWAPLLMQHWPWFVALGASGAIGQYLLIYAFKQASATIIAPFEYTALLWGIAFDWALWSTAPTVRVLCGAGIVIASGLYVIYREHWLKSSPTAAGTLPSPH